MTETEAKTKWCPMWRLGQSFDFGGYAAVNNHSASNCIGSACMMWREIVGVPDDQKQGYCGLAGKP